MIEHRLYNESNLATMARMADNSVDAIVTDPPYGLGSPPPIVDVLTAWLAGEVYHPGGRGFMGKEWDAFVPGPEIWRECFRVLKPGGHLISFFGTRTYHLGTLAIQMAGFEVRDQLAWIYGCLSDDTEVLTEHGWKLYSHIRKSKNIRIFAYNKTTDTYELELPEKWSEYQINDTCFRIKSDFTDQVVSRHHRCLVEREGVLVFETAEQVWEKGWARVPFLEGVSNLPSTFSMRDQGAGCSQADVLKGLRERDDLAATEECPEGKEMRDDGGVRCLRDGDNKAKCLAAEGFYSNVQQGVQRKIAGEEPCAVFAQRAGGLDGAINEVIFKQDDRREQSGMEGWGYAWREEGELSQVENKVGEMPERVSWHGSSRRVGYGGEANCCAGDRAQLDKGGECASCGSQPGEQSSREFDAIFEQCGSQAFRARTGYKTTLADVTAIEYTGIVFCPTVSTGAFVARRNGHIFLTGNSGFPKGQDISKAIDKALGHEREVVATKTKKAGDITGGNFKRAGSYPDIELSITAPSSPLAIKYDGWNTNLKPAMESICLARKPLIGTVAANVMEHGTGGLNIDGCRIGEYGARNNGSKAADDGYQKNDIYGKRMPSERVDYEKGRYPANVLHDGSPEVLQFFPSAPGQLGPSRTTPGEKTNAIYGKMNHNSEQMMPMKDESTSAARFFYTAKASSKERGDFNDHPTVKPIDLMRWLVRLITPPGGVVYDPFAGSGSTLIAAFQEGFECIGSELDAHYCDIYEKRKLMFPRTQSLL